MNLPSFGPRLRAAEWRLGIIGGGFLLVAVVVAFFRPRPFYQAYLFAYVFWLHITLGVLALLMMHVLTGGRWGEAIRPFARLTLRTLPLLTVLFVPLLLGLGELYAWADPHTVAHDHLLRHKSPYLNRGFFGVRAAFYFAIWLGLAWYINRGLSQQDPHAGDRWRPRLQTVSGPGLILYAFTVTFAFTDWVMSLEAHWYSTMYGFIWIAGQLLGGLAFLIMWLIVQPPESGLSDPLAAGGRHDLGKLLLAFVMLWAYVSFSQYLIIWSGNLPEEISWYLHRTRHGWQWVAAGLMLLHFALPFCLLLSRRTKEDPRWLAAIAGGVLVMRGVDTFWLVKPAFQESGSPVHWLDALVFPGMGGIWFAMLLRTRRSDERSQGPRPASSGQSPRLREDKRDE